MIREDLNHTIAHLVSMQYSTVEIRHQAMLEDVLAGPQGLHELLPDPARPRSTRDRKQFSDAQLEADREAFPAVRRKKPPRKGRDSVEVPGRVSQLITAGLAPIRQLRSAASAVPGVPRGRDPRDGRQVVPPGVATTPRSSR